MAADPRDLTTVALVESYLTGVVSSASTDALIQGLVTAASVYILNRCGRDSLNSVASYTETYDGSGSRRQFLRNTPIVTVTSLTVAAGGGAAAVPPSANGIQPGYVIDQRGKSLVIVGTPLAGGAPTGFFTVWRFPEGIQNVFVSYTAGYSSVPPDLEQAATQLVAVNYRRRGWVDQVSQQLPQAGSLTYRNWELPPEVERAIQNYTRRAIV